MLVNSPKTVLMENVRLAQNVFSRFLGLMFEKAENFDYALVFTLPREGRIGASVHMMFVFFPIDIVFLDSQKKVVDKAALHPWMLNYTPKKAAKYFIELPQGKARKISVGNSLKW